MLADSLIECGAVLFGEFTLTSGAKSRYYVDIKKATSEPAVLSEIAAGIAARLSDEEIVAGMELGAVPIAVAVSLEAGIPFAIVRKEPRKHGTGRQVEGPEVKGKRVLVVEDVATSGGSVAKAVAALRAEGARVGRAITVVDRQEGAREALAKDQVRLESLVSRDELLALA